MTLYLKDLKVICDNEISLKEGASKIVQILRPEWNVKDHQFKQFNEGITNTLIGVYMPENKMDMILIRIYGAKTEMFIDREAEIRNMQLLSDAGFGSKLYASFQNGLAYQFVPGEILSPETVSNPDIFPLVAATMATMHKIIPGGGKTSMLWSKLRQFNELSPDEFPDDLEKHNRYKANVMSKEIRSQQIDLLEKLLKDSDSPIVFCHNDLLLANIIIGPDKKVSFIDFEYGDFNYQAFDIADHFCEFSGINAQFMDYAKYYPSKEFQLKWLRSYCQAYTQGQDPTPEFLESMYATVNKFALCARLFWATWGLVQAKISNLDFDFLNYATLQLEEFQKKKEEFLSL